MPDNRYLRHEQIDGFSQSRVSSLDILVIGAGAIGNEVIKNLCLLGTGQITVFDFDRVERHNLTRSVLLRESDIGHNKAVSVTNRARELDPGVTVEAVPGDIHETLSLERVGRADLVIACTDNFEARIRINQICWLTGTAWINTAIDSRYGSVELFPFDRSSNCACYECTLPDSVYARLGERQSCGGLLKAALEQQVMPTTTISTSITAALACNEALKHCGCDNRLTTQTEQTEQRELATPANGGAIRLFTDTLSGTSSRVTIASASLCAGCGILPANPRLLARVANGNDLAAAVADNAPGATDDEVIVLSDKLIWYCACERCGRQPHTSRFEGRRAASLTDAISICPRCQQSAVKIDVREQFSVRELSERFGERSIPARWGLMGDAIIEFGAN